MRGFKTFFNSSLMIHFSSFLNCGRCCYDNDLRRILRAKKGFFNDICEKDDDGVLKTLNAFINHPE